MREFKTDSLVLDLEQVLGYFQSPDKEVVYIITNLSTKTQDGWKDLISLFGDQAESFKSQYSAYLSTPSKPCDEARIDRIATDLASIKMMNGDFDPYKDIPVIKETANLIVKYRAFNEN
nr:MAG TPA: hypothetical protein [Caudoviricetes sp.]